MSDETDTTGKGILERLEQLRRRGWGELDGGRYDAADVLPLLDVAEAAQRLCDAESEWVDDDWRDSGGRPMPVVSRQDGTPVQFTRDPKTGEWVRVPRRRWWRR